MSPQTGEGIAPPGAGQGERRRRRSAGCRPSGRLRHRRGAGTRAPGRPGAPPPAAAITFMSRDNGTDLEPYKQGIARFNASQSKVKVTHEIATSAAGTNYFQKLQTMVVSGTPPDVSYMHSANTPTFAAEGTLAALDAVPAAGQGGAGRAAAQRGGLLPLEGALVGVPDVATSLVMYVNRVALRAQPGRPSPPRSGPGRTTSPPPSASPTPAAPTAPSGRWTTTATSPATPCCGRTTPTCSTRTAPRSPSTSPRRSRP